MSLFRELKRRNVIRVGVAYVVTAWLIIQVVETIFPAFGFDESAVRVTTIVLVICFLPTLLFAWVFELTPEGLKKERDVDRSESITHQTGKQLDRLIMLVLVVALGYFAFDKFILEPMREAKMEEQRATAVEQARQEGRSEALVGSYGDKSIAVLAFEDMSPDRDQAYLSDGIAEELINLLAKIPELRVISRSSAFSFKGKNISIPEVAKQLNVAHLLEGSVRKAGDRVRITAQLIEARSDTHLWSQTYDRTLDDIFAVQDEIAATVVKQLKIELLGQGPLTKKTDPNAYSLFLQARFLGRQINAESLQQSNSLYQQALSIDPNYAAAWDGLSTNYCNQADHGLVPTAEGYSRAREATEKALSIDPLYAAGHAGLGWIAMEYDNDLPAAARHFQKALQLDSSNLDIIRNAASLLPGLGRLDEAVTIGKHLIDRDPINPISHYNLGAVYVLAGRWDEGIASLETVLRLNSSTIGAHYWIGTARLFKGEIESALVAFDREGWAKYQIKGHAMALHALGREDEAQARMQLLIEQWGDQWPSDVAQAFAFIGDTDAAFHWLDKAFAQNEVDLHQQFLSPFFRTIHADPRWSAFLERVGSSPEQLNAIEFEVPLPE